MYNKPKYLVQIYGNSLTNNRAISPSVKTYIIYRFPRQRNYDIERKQEALIGDEAVTHPLKTITVSH